MHVLYEHNSRLSFCQYEKCKLSIDLGQSNNSFSKLICNKTPWKAYIYMHKYIHAIQLQSMVLGKKRTLKQSRKSKLHIFWFGLSYSHKLRKLMMIRVKLTCSNGIQGCLAIMLHHIQYLISFQGSRIRVCAVGPIWLENSPPSWYGFVRWWNWWGPARLIN